MDEDGEIPPSNQKHGRWSNPAPYMLPHSAFPLVWLFAHSPIFFLRQQHHILSLPSSSSSIGCPLPQGASSIFSSSSSSGRSFSSSSSSALCHNGLSSLSIARTHVFLRRPMKLFFGTGERERERERERGDPCRTAPTKPSALIISPLSPLR